MPPDSVPAAGETIGQRLKRLRLERGFSQRELAAPGVSYAYISRIEAGTRQPSVKALRRLAAKLEVSADYLETGSKIDPAADREIRLSNLELAVRLGAADGVEEPLNAAGAGTVASGDASLAARYAAQLSYALSDIGELGRAEAVVRRALDSVKDSEDPYMRVRLYWSIARLAHTEGREGAALTNIRKAIALLQATE